MLGAQAAPVVNGDIASFGDAEQRVVCLEIVSAREIGLVGRDNGDVEVIGEREQKGLDRALGQPVALEFDVKPIAENALELLGARAGKFAIAFGELRSIGPSTPPLSAMRPSARAARSAMKVTVSPVSLAAKWAAVEMHEIGIALRILSQQRDAPVGLRSRCSPPGSGLAGKDAKASESVMPVIGCTPSLASASENSSAPKRLSVSVSASAGAASARASAASFSTVSAPSSSE